MKATNFNSSRPSTHFIISTIGILVIIVAILIMALITNHRTEKPLTNNQLENLYTKSFDQSMGFDSKDYTITDYEGTKSIDIPTEPNWIRVCNVSGQNNIYYSAGKLNGEGGSRGIEISSLGSMVRVCYKEKPFYQKSSYRATGTEIYPIKFSIAEKTINNNSFVIISETYDFHGEFGGLYVNGNIISRYILTKGGVAYLPYTVKKSGNNIIVYFGSANGAKLYALYSTKTNQLVLPIDYESIKNNDKTIGFKYN